MIYTVTFNPSLDYVVRMKEFATGEINWTQQENIYPGGKGNNVSVVLSNLGVKSRALGFKAGMTGDSLEKMLKEHGIDTDFIALEKGFTRRSWKGCAEEGFVLWWTRKRRSIAVWRRGARWSIPQAQGIPWWREAPPRSAPGWRTGRRSWGFWKDWSRSGKHTAEAGHFLIEEMMRIVLSTEEHSPGGRTETEYFDGSLWKGTGLIESYGHNGCKS